MTTERKGLVLEVEPLTAFLARQMAAYEFPLETWMELPQDARADLVNEASHIARNLLQAWGGSDG